MAWCCRRDSSDWARRSRGGRTGGGLGQGDEIAMNAETENKIVSLRRAGGSIRGIARQLGIPRYQVAKVLKAHECGRAEGGSSPLPRAKKKRASCLDKYLPTLVSLVQRYQDITAVRAWEELKRKDFRGGYNVVKRAVRELRPGKRTEVGGAFRDGARSAGPDGLFDVHAGFHRGGAAAGPCLGVHPGLFAASVLAVRRVAGLHDDDPRARAGVRVSGGRGGHVPVRQHEGGGHGLRRR